MQFHFKLTKPCKHVDKYEQCDPAGTLLAPEAVTASPMYFAKTLFKGKERITVTVQ